MKNTQNFKSRPNRRRDTAIPIAEEEKLRYIFEHRDIYWTTYICVASLRFVVIIVYNPFSGIRRGILLELFTNL
jgi:hypothetical protein